MTCPVVFSDRWGSSARVEGVGFVWTQNKGLTCTIKNRKTSIKIISKRWKDVGMEVTKIVDM